MDDPGDQRLDTPVDLKSTTLFLFLLEDFHRSEVLI
jgi:hypothetical protein